MENEKRIDCWSKRQLWKRTDLVISLPTYD